MRGRKNKAFNTKWIVLKIDFNCGPLFSFDNPLMEIYPDMIALIDLINMSLVEE